MPEGAWQLVVAAVEVGKDGNATLLLDVAATVDCDELFASSLLPQAKARTRSAVAARTNARRWITARMLGLSGTRAII